MISKYLQILNFTNFSSGIMKILNCYTQKETREAFRNEKKRKNYDLYQIMCT